MLRALKAWVPLTLMFVLVACGDNNITGPPTVTPTATTTAAPVATATATAVPPTAVATFTAPPAATRTATATAIQPTATATRTFSPTTVPTPAAATAFFSEDSSNRLNPFPSDRLLDSNGHVNVPAGYLQIDAPRIPELETAYAYSELVATQLQSLDGFSTFAPMRVRFDQPMVVDSGVYPRGVLLLEYDDLTAAPAPVTAEAYDPENAIEVHPVVPLKPKTRYALVLTTAIVDHNGNHAKPSADFAKLVAGEGLSSEMTTWRQTLAPVFSYVNSAYDISAEDLVVVEVFTTQSTTDDLVAIKNRLVSGELVPGMPVFDKPLGDLQTGIFAEGSPQFADLIGQPTSSSIGSVAIGYFDSFDFRVRANAAFDPEKVHGPKIPSTNKVDFYMVMPKAPKPAGGYPIVLFGHGLGGSGRDVAAVASIGRSVPIIGIGISALQHGRRGNVTGFFNLQNIATTREYFRQSVVDFMQVIRMIKNAQAAGIAPFKDADPNHIEYLGGSLGGIMGTLFMAVEPDVQVGMLSVPGGGLPNILASKDIGQLLEPLLSLNVGIPASSPYFAPFLHRFQQSSQWALDSADPINYGPHLIQPGEQLQGVPPKRILVHEGIVDSVVPNRTTDDLALAMRLPNLNLTRGCANANGCSGIWRYVMTDYGKGETDGHGVTLLVEQATTQAFDYLLNFGTAVGDASPPAN